MNILITGGAGYIGSHINKLLSKQGHKTFIVDDLSFGNIESVKYGKFYNTDFISDTTRDIFITEAIDVVIHLAALADVNESIIFPNKYYSTNLIKSIKLLDMMLEFNVKKIIFSSTAAIFGNPLYIPIDENHSTIPITPYGKSKLYFENILFDYANIFGLKYCCLRYFNAAGCDPELEIGEAFDPPHHIIPIIFKCLVENKEFKIFGNDYNTNDGTCIRDYVHVQDIAKIHSLCLENLFNINGCENLNFNVGSNKGYSILEIIKEIESITNKKLKYVFSERRNGDPATLVASDQLVTSFFKYKYEYDLIGILQTAWNWELNKMY